MAQLKKIFSILVIIFCVSTSFCQKLQIDDSMIDDKATTYLSLSKCEACIYFSSMDWFKFVDCYNEDGKQMFHANVKKMAKKQTSQFIVLDYSDFEDGEYVIVLRKGKTKMIATLRIFDAATHVLLCDND